MPAFLPGADVTAPDRAAGVLVRPPALVIFDCDGVLVDSEPVANRVFAEVLTAAGFPMTAEQTLAELAGRSLAGCVEYLQRRFGRPLPDDFLAGLQRATFAAFAEGLRPVAGVEAALARIPVQTCVASNGEPEKLRLTLGLTGLLERFDGRLFSAMEVARGKPAPDLFLHASARMGVLPDQCVVVEDSLAGVRAAGAAGMRVLAYSGAAHTDAAALAAAGGVPFDDMALLPVLLGFAPAVDHAMADGLRD